MKIAVCLSGQPRYFEQGCSYFKKSFSGLDVDYFIHNWFHEDDVGEECIPTTPSHTTGWRVEPKSDERLIKLLSPKKYMFERQKAFCPKYNFHENTGRHGPHEPFISMLYSRKKVGELLVEYVEKTGEKYDWVFFTRTDFALLGNIENEIGQITPSEVILTAHVPGEIWNKGHLNDPFVGSDYENMKYWSTLYDHYEQYWLGGILFCGHRLAFHHMNLLGKPFKQILNPQGRAWAWLRQGGLRTF